MIRTRGGADFCPRKRGKGSRNAWAERNGADAASGRLKPRITQQADGFARKPGRGKKRRVNAAIPQGFLRFPWQACTGPRRIDDAADDAKAFGAKRGGKIKRIAFTNGKT